MLEKITEMLAEQLKMEPEKITPTTDLKEDFFYLNEFLPHQHLRLLNPL